MTEFVVPDGPVITLQDGRAIDGHIVGIDQTDIVIQGDDGSSRTLPRSTVESVAFETITGERLVGELIGWAPGVYQITTPEAAIKVYSAMPAVTRAPEPAAAPVAEAERDAEPVVSADGARGSEENVAGTEQAGASQTGSQAIAAITAEDAPDGAVEGAQDAAATPASDLAIQVSIENSRENGPPIAFNIELSRPSDSSVVLIYATIDGTAVDGQDYEANRGVLVIKPGERTARIEAPVIDDAEQEEDEHLQLFLTVDPTVATIDSRQIIATIEDDDQG